jgi:hypothetical protein
MIEFTRETRQIAIAEPSEPFPSTAKFDNTGQGDYPLGAGKLSLSGDVLEKEQLSGLDSALLLA